MIVAPANPALLRELSAMAEELAEAADHIGTLTEIASSELDDIAALLKKWDKFPEVSEWRFIETILLLARQQAVMVGKAAAQLDLVAQAQAVRS